MGLPAGRFLELKEYAEFKERVQGVYGAKGETEYTED